MHWKCVKTLKANKGVIPLASMYFSAGPDNTNKGLTEGIPSNLVFTEGYNDN